jgi:hypothetical protein
VLVWFGVHENFSSPAIAALEEVAAEALANLL